MSIASTTLLLAFFLLPRAHAHAITGSICRRRGYRQTIRNPTLGSLLLSEVELDLGLGAARNNPADQVAVLNALAADQSKIDTEIGLIAALLSGRSVGSAATGYAVAAPSHSLPDASNTALFLLAAVGGLFLISRQRRVRNLA